MADNSALVLQALWPSPLADSNSDPLSMKKGVAGALGSEGLLAREHVPDRLRESAGEVDLRHLGAALPADPRFHSLVAVTVGGVG
ncbi:MAG: hypothetical protein M3312_09700, partial [Actinomycetota bacterium]|nr:hypothetical protein [Actinomycetota bacterium]